jgi:hypothetical protein
MLTRALFPGYGTDSNKLVERMTAKGVEDLAKQLLRKIGTSRSFIYGIDLCSRNTWIAKNQPTSSPQPASTVWH